MSNTLFEEAVAATAGMEQPILAGMLLIGISVLVYLWILNRRADAAYKAIYAREYHRKQIKGGCPR